jgi:hypothetical protein
MPYLQLRVHLASLICLLSNIQARVVDAGGQQVPALTTDGKAARRWVLKTHILKMVVAAAKENEQLLELLRSAEAQSQFLEADIGIVTLTNFQQLAAKYIADAKSTLAGTAMQEVWTYVGKLSEACPQFSSWTQDSLDRVELEKFVTIVDMEKTKTLLKIVHPGVCDVLTILKEFACDLKATDAKTKSLAAQISTANHAISHAKNCIALRSAGQVLATPGIIATKELETKQQTWDKLGAKLPASVLNALKEKLKKP